VVLNDVALGGETEFPHLGLSVKPEAGRLLIFPAVLDVSTPGFCRRVGDKYILSTYLLLKWPSRIIQHHLPDTG